MPSFLGTGTIGTAGAGRAQADVAAARRPDRLAVELVFDEGDGSSAGRPFGLRAEVPLAAAFAGRVGTGGAAVALAGRSLRFELVLVVAGTAEGGPLLDLHRHAGEWTIEGEPAALLRPASARPIAAIAPAPVPPAGEPVALPPPAAAAPDAPKRRCSPLPVWRLKRTFAYIEAHLSERVSLADLAAAAGLTRMHFAAQFRVATGTSPHEYLLRRRIERAQEMMHETRETLVSIALAVGFQTQAHFTTVFKRFVGETPHRWRRAAVGGA